MTDKATRELMSSPDSTDSNDNDHFIHQARSTSGATQDEDSIDLLDTSQDEAMESTPAHSCNPSSSQGIQTRKETAPSMFPNVIRRLPFFGGSPQRNQIIPIEDHLKITGKLESDLEGLNRAYQNLETEYRNALINNKKLSGEKEMLKEKYTAYKVAAVDHMKRAQERIRLDKATNERLLKNLVAANTEIEDLQMVEYNYQEEIARLNSTVDDVTFDLRTEKERGRKETAQLHTQIKTISEMNDKFRQMLVPVSEKQISDGEVVQKFTALRSSILAFVRRTWTLEFRAGIDIRTLPKGHREFFQSSIPPSYDRLRYVVSVFLYQVIFEAPNYFLGDDHQRFEGHLQNLERHLFKISPNENLKLAMDWRNASFKATEAFRGDGHRLSSITQEQIWHFLSVLEMTAATSVEAGKEKLEAICDSAVELHLMLRQSKDNFWIDAMHRAVDQPISVWTELAEQMAHVQTVDGKQPGTIAYVIAGALVKSPKGDLGKVLVLEKAEVAVYC